jgi:Holliday junction resolvasome RuvABC DNA-binding subunit
MMNPKILKLASLPVEMAGKNPQQPTKSGKAGEVFGANFKDFWNHAQKMWEQGASGFNHKGLPVKTGNPLDPKIALKRQISEMIGAFRKGMPHRMGHKSQIDQLREGLLAKGKPLNQISLKQEDQALLKKLLLHLGFSEKQGEDIIKGLAEKNPGGEILLSQFVQHISDLGIPEKESFQHIEPSVMPQLESALRALGLKPQEVERIFAEARTKQGGLDLTKLVAELKEFHSEMGEKAGSGDRQVAFNQISDKLEKIGLHTQVTSKPGEISLKEFIASLEQMSGDKAQGDPLSADIKETINRILERVSLSKEYAETPATLTSLGKLKVDPSAVNANMVGKGKPVNRVASFKKGEAFQRRDPFAPQTGKETNQTIHGAQKPGSPNPIKGVGSISDVNGDHGAAKGLKGENSGIQPEKATFPVPGQTTGTTFSETMHAIKQNQTPPRDVLPAYLVDQLGRQISRSIQRGDRVLKIQLKPPELGVVKVELDLKENVLKLGMIAENSTVKELLLANANELKEALVEQGVKLEKVDVQIGDHFNQTLNNLKEGQKEGRNGNQGENSGLSHSDDRGVESHAGTRGPLRKDQLLDLVA